MSVAIMYVMGYTECNKSATDRYVHFNYRSIFSVLSTILSRIKVAFRTREGGGTRKGQKKRGGGEGVDSKSIWPQVDHHRGRSDTKYIPL